MNSLSEQITIPSPVDAVWPLLSDPALVAACIPGATLTDAGEDGVHRGSIRVKFGPTVAVFRGEATLSYDHTARRCTIEGRGIDQRGASRALASGTVVATGGDTTVLSIEGGFNVTGPLETFANAGGIHLARALLAEFAENMARMVAERGEAAAGTAAEPEQAEQAEPEMTGRAGPAPTAPKPAEPRPAAPRPAAELSGGRLLWRAFRSWIKELFRGKRM